MRRTASRVRNGWPKTGGNREGRGDSRLGKKNGVGIATDPTLTGGGFPKKRLSPGVSPSVPHPGGIGHQDMSPGARAGAEPVPGQVRGSEDRSRQVWRPVRSRGFHLASQAAPRSSKLPADAIDAGIHNSGHRRKFVRFHRLEELPPEGVGSSFLHRDSASVASRSFRFSLSCLGRRSREAIRFRSRWIENAPGGRVGQGRKRRLIHFRPKCQWTRVDKFTVGRRTRNILTLSRRCSTKTTLRRHRITACYAGPAVGVAGR